MHPACARTHAARLCVSSGLAMAFALLPQPTAAKGTSLEALYVVMGKQGPVARAVLKNTDQCPEIAIDGTSQAMSVRAPPDTGKKAAFPVLVCEALIPAGATAAQVDGEELALPKATLKTIVALGDTGCRLKASKKAKPNDHDEEPSGKFQDCNKPKRWPFKKLSTSAAAKSPDLVIHVGDYLYRESPCPSGDKGCQGSPHHDDWKTWKADFFTPAKSLLRAAPWIMTRGNHETCKRAGLGYLRLLDPTLADGQVPPACSDVLPHHKLTIGGKPFILMDTSNADDACTPTACNSGPYAAEFDKMQPEPGTWLVTHKPVWGFKNKGVTLTDTLQDALAGPKLNGQLPSGIDLALAGHIHLWEALSFADGRSPQLVLGNGSTMLAHKIKPPLTGQNIGGRTVSFGRSEHSWGFTLLSPAQDGASWTATLLDVDGAEQFNCTVTAAAIACP